MLLRRSGSFRLLFVATLGSGLGTWMATIALTADVTARTGSPWWVSLLFIVTFLPSIVVGLAAGPLIDRLSRKRLIISSDLVRFGVFIVLPFVHSPSGIIARARGSRGGSHSPSRCLRSGRTTWPRSASPSGRSTAVRSATGCSGRQLGSGS